MVLEVIGGEKSTQHLFYSPGAFIFLLLARTAYLGAVLA